MPGSDDQRERGAGGSRKPGKSVRWTGQDYFSYAGGSGNRPDRGQAAGGAAGSSSAANARDDPSDSSDSDTEESETDDAARFRATTRANTWFNRLRQEDDDDDDGSVGGGGGGRGAPDRGGRAEADDDDDDDDDDDSAYGRHDRRYAGGRLRNADAARNAPESRPLVREPRTASPLENQVPFPERPAPVLPSIQVSHHDLNPYQHLMDIGTHISGGLGPGGHETRPEDDPLDAEYRERRNRLLATLGTHSQLSSPTLHPTEHNSDIPMSDFLPPTRQEFPADSHSPPSLGATAGVRADPNDVLTPPAAPQRVRTEVPKYDDLDGDTTSSSTDTPPPRQYNDDTAREADSLRRKLEFMQQERVHRMGKIIEDRRRQRGESISSTSKQNRPRKASDVSSTNSSEYSRTKNDEEEEELKRLEEANRLQAEEHAKSLVQAHLGATLLSTKPDNDGYVQNPSYLLDAANDNEGVPIDVHGEVVGGDHGERNFGQDSSESDEKKCASETSSSDTLKQNEKQKETADDDSDSESDTERKDVNLRGDPGYVPPPRRVKEGVLGSLLRLYAGQEDGEDTKSTASLPMSPSPSPSVTPVSTPLGSPTVAPSEYSVSGADRLSGLSPQAGSTQEQKRPKRPGYFHTYSSEDVLGRENKGRPKWYKRPSSSNVSSLGHLATSGLSAAGGVASQVASAAAHQAHNSHNFQRRMEKSGQHMANDIADIAHKFERKTHHGDPAALRDKESKRLAKKADQKRREKEKALKKARLAEQARITVHIADVLQRQRFLLRLGRALMLFGAPSHRLEDYLTSTARVLEIDAQVLYIPGCILISFGDATTHTSETKLIRVTQGLNLAKLHATHLIYKEVIHDLMSLEEASSHIDHLLRSKNMYPTWLVVLFYGVACMCCGMFAYGAYWRDIPIIFLLGGGVGVLQYWVQPKSDLYANVFEVSSSILVSFAGRALGSIGDTSDYIFCFASIVQASLALILPGYIILVGALELQTKNLVAGSVRMFYANIYSLFLSFGITLGSAIFGWCYGGAVTNTTCQHSSDVDPKWKILFVPCATLFMALVNQAGPRQLPVMVVIGSAGYAVQYFVDQNVKASAFTSAIGAFTMGVLGNLYSRVGHGLAFAAMLPGIFTLVPSGVAAQGSLVAGVKVATEIVNASHSADKDAQAAQSGQTISQLGNSMTQVAVGIVVGLFAATLVVYPIGFKKKRSGLFTF